MLIKHIGFLLVLMPYLAVVSVKSPQYFSCLVALKLLVSLIIRLVACSVRIVMDRQTDTENYTTVTHSLCNHSLSDTIVSYVTLPSH